MSKIFNWVFSGFFLTIGRFIVYILLALLLGYIFKDTKISDFVLFTNVHAEWYDNIQYYPSNVSIYNCTSSGCSAINGSWQDLIVDNNVRGSWEMYSSINELVIAQNGIVLSNYLQSNLYEGYLYLIQTYFCTSYSGSYNTFQANLNLGWSFANTATTEQVGTTYHNTAISTFGDAIAGNTCYIANSLVVPNGTKQVAGLHLYRSSGSVNSVVSLVGFSITNIGLYDAVTNSSLASAITNSGFASASSVQEVQDSVEQVQQDLQDLNEQNIQNTQDTINSQKVCKTIIVSKTDIKTDNRFLNDSGELTVNDAYGVTDYIEIDEREFTKLSTAGVGPSICFYTENKSLISCTRNGNMQIGNNIAPVNTKYIRVSIQKETDAPQYKIVQCKNGNQALNDSINDSNVSDTTNDASNFFSNFNTNTHGLTGIITSPLLAIQSLTSQTCEPLVLPLPFVNENLTLPCMRSIYLEYFGDFMTLYDIITLGIISYWVLVRIFALVKDFKNPEHDEIEVVDL